jgi:Protein of unknown function (DUF1254)
VRPRPIQEDVVAFAVGTLYSFAIFDFDAGSVTIELPDRAEPFHGNAGRQ